MKPFDENAKCVKCGGIDIHTHYKPANEPAFMYRHFPKCECIVRRCNRCGYVWVEQPLDTRKKRLKIPIDNINNIH